MVDMLVINMADQIDAEKGATRVKAGTARVAEAARLEAEAVEPQAFCLIDSGRSPKFLVRPNRSKDFVYQGGAEPQITFCLTKSGVAPDHFLFDQVGAGPKISV